MVQILVAGYYRFYMKIFQEDMWWKFLRTVIEGINLKLDILGKQDKIQVSGVDVR